MDPVGRLPDEVQTLVEDWLTQNAGSRKATINDVARLAGVSKKTISRIINDSPLVKAETRELVNTIIKAIDYSPDPQARGLAFRHSFLVGMIYDNPNPQYIVNMQQGILDGLRGTDYELVVHPCDRDNPDYILQARAFVERQKLYGVVLTPSISEDESLVEVLRQIGCAYVRIASIKLDEDRHMLVSNDRIGGREAGRHLIQLGHRRIASVRGRRGFRSAVEREAGLRDSLEEAGLSLPQDHVIEGDYTFESGLAACDELLKLSPRPTAIFAANDEMAAGVLQGLRRAGLRAPDAMSVVGFDDFQIASNVWPRLTTIHIPTRDMGCQAATRLLKPDAEAGTHDVITPWLVKRDSSGPPAKV